MINNNIYKLCNKLELGEICTEPHQIFGGLLHIMYKVETDKGSYAIKLLNPNIMKRETAIKNYILSEKIAKIAYNNNIPAVTTINSDNCFYKIDNDYYMVFNWVDACSITSKDVTCYHCKIIGKILAKIHTIDFSLIEEKENHEEILTEINWDKYINTDEVWVDDLLEIIVLLQNREKQANLVFKNIMKNQVISHRDMDCKNVLWDDKNNPKIIDWEAAGFVNPLQELINVALAWSGSETEEFSLEKFREVIASYLENGGTIIDDAYDVLIFDFKGKFEWLEYNIKRSLGLESSNIDEQKLGTKEVINTIEAIKKYEELIPIIKDTISCYISK